MRPRNLAIIILLLRYVISLLGEYSPLSFLVFDPKRFKLLLSVNTTLPLCPPNATIPATASTPRTTEG